jgi:hypothetical protein
MNLLQGQTGGFDKCLDYGKWKSLPNGGAHVLAGLHRTP